MTNEARRAEIERMQQKSRQAENRRKLWQWIPCSESMGWQVPAAVGVAVVAAAVFYYYHS